MNFRNLIEEANNLADDFLTEEEAKGFVNDAISAINIEVNATFPLLEDMEDVPVFPEKWQRMLIIPFTKGRIKEKDSSQFEWEAGYEEFYFNLNLFKKHYDIPDEYKEKDDRYNDVGRSMLEQRPFLWGGW